MGFYCYYPPTNLVTATISGTVAVTQSTSPWAVSGTVAVSNFPATQPVSGTVTANQGTTPWIVDGSGSTQPVSGTVAATQSGAWTVTANAGTNLNTSALALDSSIGTLNTSVNTLLKPASTLAAVTTVGSITNALPAGSNVIGHVITDSGSVVNATLSAETTKVIGTVNQGTSPWVISGTVTANPASGSLTDRSTNVTTVSSEIVPANSARKYIFIQNQSGTTCWIDFGVAATNASPSIRLNNNDVFVMEGSFISTQAINGRSGSGTQPLTIKEG